MKISSAQTKLIHVARKQLGLQDDEYRTILKSVCGVESSTQIKTRHDYEELIKAFIRLGFSPEKAIRKVAAPRTSTASPDQIKRIQDLWLIVTDHPGDNNALNKFLQNRFRVDHLNVVSKQKASAIIEALKEMFNRKYLATVYEKMFGESANVAMLYSCFRGFINELSNHEAKLILAAVACHDDRVLNAINQKITTIEIKEVDHAGNQNNSKHQNN